jgi:hypothetical protein
VSISQSTLSARDLTRSSTTRLDGSVRSPSAHGWPASTITMQMPSYCDRRAALADAIQIAAAGSVRADAQPPTPLAAFIALRDDPRLLLRRPDAAPTSPRKHLQPAHLLRLRFGQKLSVRHVSNPFDSGQTIADQQPALKMRPKGRLPISG